MFNAAILCSAMEVIPVLGQKQLCKWSLQFCALSAQESFKIQQRGNLMDENTLKSLKTQITSRRKQVLLHSGCHQRFKAAELGQDNFFSYVDLIFSSMVSYSSPCSRAHSTSHRADPFGKPNSRTMQAELQTSSRNSLTPAVLQFAVPGSIWDHDLWFCLH